ncbi:aminopeptidase [Natranaerovirga pectinivora]|uniref:Aminopeptidase n=1 Tax=Natranaerovirga pectinivora TaxID=682400 RepID=A0A4R3MGX2_9FIRM|nr:aminopeptidase [Natranaerovirga pectinivora]TCT13071.1 aminopeptidase [Natranaerovirga pectinivora]
MDERIKTLAKNLVNYSLKVEKGEHVLIHHSGSATELLAKELITQVYNAGGLPFIHTSNRRLEREQMLQGTKEQFELMAKADGLLMENMDCYIGLRGDDNVSELGDVPAEKRKLYDAHYSTPVHHDIRVPNTKWVVLRYPNNAMAQLASMSLDRFEEFYFNVCNLDYSKMSKAMDSLIALMDKTDKVHIKGPNTDLTFSIKDIPNIKCAGNMNIPDGEVFTAPLKDSVNGKLSYNVPAIYQGFTYENITLEFKDGKIINATSNDTDRINQVFDTDEGARFIGEFAIGVNPFIIKPMKDTLFDEKIMGSFHFTPGNAYKEAFNGNKSAIHWDLVCIQTPEYGGGEIYFDNVLIRKDGMFVLPELECLNPENLK